MYSLERKVSYCFSLRIRLMDSRQTQHREVKLKEKERGVGVGCTDEKVRDWLRLSDELSLFKVGDDPCEDDVAGGIDDEDDCEYYYNLQRITLSLPFYPIYEHGEKEKAREMIDAFLRKPAS